MSSSTTEELADLGEDEHGERLLASIAKRMMSDALFRVFLPGGVDNSTNVAPMSELMSESVKHVLGRIPRSLGMLGLLAIGSAATRAQSGCGVADESTGEVPGRVRLMLRSLASTWPIRPTIVTLTITVAILTPTVLFARHLEAEHESWESSVSNNPKVVLAADRRDAVPVAARLAIQPLGSYS